MKVYLSGPIERVAEDSELSWFDEAEKTLTGAGVEVFNPMKEGCNVLIDAGLGVRTTDDLAGDQLQATRLRANAEFLAIKKDVDQLSRFRALMNKLVDMDMNEVRKSDLVLVHISPAIAGGTAGEITLARHLNIPVVGFCPLDPCMVSGWCLAIADSIFTGPSAFKDAINEVIAEGHELALPGCLKC